MDLDRRNFFLAVSATAIAGCSRAASMPTPAGSVWPTFRSRFMQPDGRIVDTGNNGVSHSEGQGYAMLFAEAAGDRKSFDRLWKWTRATLSREQDALFAWRYDPRAAKPVSDPNNATDGDILIAWALMRAARRWEDAQYETRSAAIRAAVLHDLARDYGGRTLLLPGLNGFVDTRRVTVNPAYYVWPALDAFAATDGALWHPLMRDGEALIAAARFGPHALPSDWVDVGPDGGVAPSAGRPPRFGYDAIRVPLYAVMGNRKALAEPAARWWSAAMPAVPAWIDVVTGETAEYPLSDGGQTALNRVLGRPLSDTVSTDYYSAALQGLAHL